MTVVLVVASAILLWFFAGTVFEMAIGEAQPALFLFAGLPAGVAGVILTAWTYKRTKRGSGGAGRNIGSATP